MFILGSTERKIVKLQAEIFHAVVVIDDDDDDDDDNDDDDDGDDEYDNKRY